MKIIVAFLLVGSICSSNLVAQSRISDYVDPFIGTAAHGHTFPGATLPFGMVQLSPDTDVHGWDWCSGYHASDSTIMGFSHTHLSGTGGADYGDILLMPFSGPVRLEAGPKDDPAAGYRSRFSHESERASPGYYSVRLKDYDIMVELTATERVGVHKYTFSLQDDASLLVDLDHGISDRTTESCIKVVDQREISGLRRSKGWASDQRVYFSMRFSRPFKGVKFYRDGRMLEHDDGCNGKNVKAVFDFSSEKDNQLMVKVALSAVDEEGARKNLRQECPDWDFSAIRNSAADKWDSYLNKITVQGGREQHKKIFYTAFYHALIHPNIYMDVDGRYRGMDGKIHVADGFKNYTLFSLWDTFRATHPFYNLFFPQSNLDFIRSMLVKYDQYGLLPVWELAANETGTMIGYHAVPVIVDAFMKNYRDFDVDKAYEAIKKSAMQDHLGLDSYKRLHFIPAELEGNSVSKTLEYAYDDWCIARMARALGHDEDYARFIDRAGNYKNVFNRAAGFMAGRYRNGLWRENFDPAGASALGHGDFTEGNSWQYTWSVQQDISGLIRLMGGDEAFVRKLDQLFVAGGPDGHAPADMTGLIGQYAHGNEPSHHIAYLYSYAGQPWKTQRMVRRVMDELYSSRRDGLCGNEDCGQMSAWYLFSAMGFYPVTPGSNIYAMGSPVFEKTELHLPNGKTFTISANNNDSRHIYIKSATLNGQPFDRTYLTFDEIMAGGRLDLEMAGQPNKNRGISKESRPLSAITDELIPVEERKVFVPYLRGGGSPSQLFDEKREVVLLCATPGATIRYTMDGTAPDQFSDVYSEPLLINQSITLRARAFRDGLEASEPLEITFRKAIFRADSDSLYPSISLEFAPHKRYSPGGPQGLIDGRMGTDKYWNGSWLGFQKDDLVATIDLGKVRHLAGIYTRFLRDQGSWIFLPRQVEIAVSSDGREFEPVALKILDETYPAAPLTIREVGTGTIDKEARFIRVVAKNEGVCPGWHNGNGGPAFLFCDEIIIEPADN